MDSESDLYRGFICNVEFYDGFNLVDRGEGVYTDYALSLSEEYRKEALKYGARCKDIATKSVLYQVICYNEDLDVIDRVMYFKHCLIDNTELLELQFREFSSELMDVRYLTIADKELCDQAYMEEKSKRVVPLTLKEANEFVQRYHRHHGSVTGCKFAIGLKKTVGNRDELIGVAICGRPVSRHLDDGLTLEVNRLCVTESGNTCSKLYSACSRIAKEMGYRKILTYILESEDGASLKASGFYLEDACCGGKAWTGSRKNKNVKQPPEEMKKRYARMLM